MTFLLFKMKIPPEYDELQRDISSSTGTFAKPELCFISKTENPSRPGAVFWLIAQNKLFFANKRNHYTRGSKPGYQKLSVQCHQYRFGCKFVAQLETRAEVDLANESFYDLGELKKSLKI